MFLASQISDILQLDKCKLRRSAAGVTETCVRSWFIVSCVRTSLIRPGLGRRVSQSNKEGVRCEYQS